MVSIQSPRSLWQIYWWKTTSLVSFQLSSFLYIIGTRARERYPGGCPMRYLEIGEARGAEERESVREERGRGRGQEGIKYPFIGIS